MIRVVDCAPCGPIEVTADPGIPLSVKWQLAVRSGILNLYIRGIDGGYVEMRVDESTGALVELVVIQAPPDGPSRCSIPSDLPTSETVVLNREIWEWHVTPDYIEPARRDASVSQKLSWSVLDNTVSLLFGESEVSRLIGSPDAVVGISKSRELACMTVRLPNVELPQGYPVST